MQMFIMINHLQKPVFEDSIQFTTQNQLDWKSKTKSFKYSEIMKADVSDAYTSLNKILTINIIWYK